MRNAAGGAAVVRNVYQPKREIPTRVGPVTVRVPKVRSRNGESFAFTRRFLEIHQESVHSGTRSLQQLQIPAIAYPHGRHHVWNSACYPHDQSRQLLVRQRARCSVEGFLSEGKYCAQKTGMHQGEQYGQ